MGLPQHKTQCMNVVQTFEPQAFEVSLHNKGLTIQSATLLKTDDMEIHRERLLKHSLNHQMHFLLFIKGTA